MYDHVVVPDTIHGALGTPATCEQPDSPASRTDFARSHGSGLVRRADEGHCGSIEIPLRITFDVHGS